MIKTSLQKKINLGEHRLVLVFSSRVDATGGRGRARISTGSLVLSFKSLGMVYTN